MLEASCKVAFAAMLHDLGKFTERAKVEVPQDKLDLHVQLYCPRRRTPDGKEYSTHKHAAYTALSIDLIEKHAPDLIQTDMYPFAERSELDVSVESFINAAAMHHRPDTFMQWIIATADRVGSGFERDEFEKYNQSDDVIIHKTRRTGTNHYQARLLTQFEQILLDSQKSANNFSNEDLNWCYPLKPLSAKSIFPMARDDIEPSDNASAQAEYRELWDDFVVALEKIPYSHRQNWSLWLDHFDTLWQSYTHGIPSATAFGVKPEVSLYDHSKTTAALAVALWRWHEENNQISAEAAMHLKERTDWEEQKFLLIQGDFFGIQNFIFSSGSQTNKNSAKLLRGRSFQVSLFAELAALKILQYCQLPATSQIINAAGKFMILAPNTESVKQQLELARQEINGWFIQHSLGQVGLGLASHPLSCNDFTDKKRFRQLIQDLFAQLEVAKLRRFDLLECQQHVLDVNYPHGVCIYNDKLPASGESQPSLISQDQILLGSLLTTHNRLMVLSSPESIQVNERTKFLQLPIFGFYIAFTGDEELTGKFGMLAEQSKMIRCWDFALPKNLTETVWAGYARRYVNAYVPRVHSDDRLTSDKYTESVLEEDFKIDQVKTFAHLACEDKVLHANGKWLGIAALSTLKGDVDNLGRIFEVGLAQPTFAKMAALSRQMNHFFSLWLPTYCQEHVKYRHVYTVFAGGDDFFMIGPWLTTQSLAADMAKEFAHYVAENDDLHFSAGVAITKPNIPLSKLSREAEEALDKSKSYQDCRSLLANQAKYPDKNAVTIFAQTVSWNEWDKVQSAQEELAFLRDNYAISTSYLYGVLSLVDLAADRTNIQSSMWRSRLEYRTYRYVQDQHFQDRQAVKQSFVSFFGERGIQQLGSAFRIPIFNHIYLSRIR